MNRIKQTLLLFCFSLLTLYTYAQDKEIEGTVEDNNGEPLPGVNITVKGEEGSGTQTDFDGNYSFTAEKGSTLKFSYVGFKEQTVEVNDDTDDQTIDITMTEGSSELDEVVIVGYGTQKKENLTGSVSTVDADVVKSRPVSNVSNALQGTTPGLNITNSTGEIGTNPSIHLRGAVGSLGSDTDATPLILVDGVEVPDINAVDPNNIEDISVLKDAASSSIYGSRAAWGVIKITTKKGKRETEPTISYTNNISWSTPTDMPKMATAAENAEMALQANRRTDPNQNSFEVIGYSIDEESVDRMKEWEDKYGDKDLGPEMKEGRDFERRNGGLYFYRSWDPMDMFVKKWRPKQQHNFSISGGTKKTSYHLNLGYVNEEGVLKVNSDDFQRYNLDLNLETDLRDWWTVRTNISFSNKVKKEPYSYSSDTYDPWYYVTRWPANYPYGTFEGEPFRSALTEMEQANTNKNKQNFSRIQLGNTFKPLDELTIDVDYTHDSNENHKHQKGGTVTGYNFWSTGPNLESKQYTSDTYDRAIYNSSWNRRNYLNAVATYDDNFGDHSIKVMGGGELERYELKAHSSERQSLLDENKPELSLASGEQYVGGNRSKWSTLGFFGRINYAYKDRYLLEINGRYDGSSRLSSNDKWGFFPSISGGYVVSKEDFMEFAKPTLSFFKLRTSYGEVGNQDTNMSNIYRIMSSSDSNWLVDGKNKLAAGAPVALPSSLTWETIRDLDFGLETRFFDDDFGIDFTWYQKTVSDMQSPGATLPSTFGTTPPKRNFGEMQTRGWELTVDYEHSFENDLHINAKATLSDYKQKVTKFADESSQIPNPIAALNSDYYEGMTLGEIWGYETDRLFTEDDFDKNGDYADGVANQDKFIENSWFEFGPGDVKYKDINDDGKVDYGDNTRGDPGDQKIIGNSNPRYEFGLNVSLDWKGFDLSFFIQGVGKRDIWANGPVVIPGYRPDEGWYSHHTDYWTPENPDAFYPRLSDAGEQVNPTNFQPQTRYLLDMSYLRMKNITVGYSLPKSLIEKLDLSNFRIYLSGENLFEFDHLDVPIDPEVDYTSAGLNDTNSFGRVYPYSRTVSFGIDVSF